MTRIGGWLGVTLSALGCGEPAAEPLDACEIYACTPLLCEVRVSLDTADIEACYGDISNLPDVLSDCFDEWGTQPDCAVTFSDVVGTKVGSPVKARNLDDAIAICDAIADLVTVDGDVLDAIDAAIDVDCAISRLSQVSVGSCHTSGEVLEVSPCEHLDGVAP